jgi:hypothetical protein
MSLREDDMDAPSRLIGNFVGRVLDELKKLTVAVTSLSDAAFAISVLGYKARIHGVRLQNTGGLFENGLNYRRERRRHCSALLKCQGPGEV